MNVQSRSNYHWLLAKLRHSVKLWRHCTWSLESSQTRKSELKIDTCNNLMSYSLNSQAHYDLAWFVTKVQNLCIYFNYYKIINNCLRSCIQHQTFEWIYSPFSVGWLWRTWCSSVWLPWDITQTKWERWLSESSRTCTKRSGTQSKTTSLRTTKRPAK